MPDGEMLTTSVGVKTPADTVATDPGRAATMKAITATNRSFSTLLS
jgi:hypothetical protein